MAFYLKLLERYNTQGCSSLETPRPGVAVASPLLSPAAPRVASSFALHGNNSQLYPTPRYKKP